MKVAMEGRKKEKGMMEKGKQMEERKKEEEGMESQEDSLVMEELQREGDIQREEDMDKVFEEMKRKRPEMVVDLDGGWGSGDEEAILMDLLEEESGDEEIK